MTNSLQLFGDTLKRRHHLMIAPSLALTDPAGDTAKILREAGISAIAPLDQVGAIGDILCKVLAARDGGTLPAPEKVETCSRRHRTKRLAHLLTEIGKN